MHLYDRITDWLMTRLSDRNIQRKLTQNIFTRGTARKDARELYDICVGFCYSQTLAACVELDLFERLKHAPLDIAALAKKTAIPVDNLTVLIDSAVALKLLRYHRDKNIAIGRLGTAVLADPGISTMVRHHDLLYRDLAKPTEVLTEPLKTKMAQFWAYTQDANVETINSDQAASYSEVMATTQSTVADLVLGAFDFSIFDKLLDVGCGTGTFTRRVALENPQLSLTLYDLPPVIDLAKQNLAAQNTPMEHLTFAPGDFGSGDLPANQDISCLIRVLHDQSDQSATDLLRKVRKTLRPGGTILIAETLAGTNLREKIGRIYFGWFLLAMGRGRARTSAQVTDLLHKAGFSGVKEHPTALPMIARVITARASD